MIVPTATVIPRAQTFDDAGQRSASGKRPAVEFRPASEFPSFWMAPEWPTIRLKSITIHALQTRSLALVIC